MASLSTVQTAALIGTLEDLVEAQLDDIAAAVGVRVMPPGGDRRRVVDETGAFQPFAELLFLELRVIATAPGYSTTMRRTRALEVLALAGF